MDGVRRLPGVMHNAADLLITNHTRSRRHDTTRHAGTQIGHKRRVTVAPTLVVHRLRDLLACAEIPAKPNECDTSRNVTSLALLPHAGAMVALSLDQQLFPPKGLKPLRHWRLRV